MISRKVNDNEWSTDYTNRCGNCHKSLDENEKYCRYCGTKRGEGAFQPYQNIMQCIYGPMPQKRVHKCTACDHWWQTMLMIDNEKFCPECGSRADVYEYEGSELKKIASSYFSDLLL